MARRGKSFHPPQSSGRYYEPEEKEVHVHVPPRRKASTQPINVTRVVHHSSKGETEVEFRSPAKVGKDVKIGEGERKGKGNGRWFICIIIDGNLKNRSLLRRHQFTSISSLVSGSVVWDERV